MNSERVATSTEREEAANGLPGRYCVEAAVVGSGRPDMSDRDLEGGRPAEGGSEPTEQSFWGRLHRQMTTVESWKSDTSKNNNREKTTTRDVY